VLLGERVVALISIHAPLLLILDDLPDDILLDQDVSVVHVPAMDAPALTSDTESLQLAFGNRVLSSVAFDAERFSAEDLWFATV
jgi:hypothetical protein